MRPASIHEIKILHEEIESIMPENPVIYGWNSYAQCDEDGIIRECLKRIAVNSKISGTFIEVGCGNGLENNTHQLILDGFRGVWVEGDPVNVAHIAEEVGLLTSVLRTEQLFVTLNNIHDLMDRAIKFLHTDSPDFLSFDTDGNDLHLVTSALETVRPKLICVEYNGKFPPPTRLVMRYNENHNWAQDDYYGASLQSWVDALDKYRLVACNLSGVNAFFVRNDVATLFHQYPIDAIFQPARYWLIGIWGHPHTMKWLKQVVGGDEGDCKRIDNTYP